jgi:DNA primase
MIKNVSDILDAARVVDVVGDFVTLKRSGANYTGLCPFHQENTPSFMVNEKRNIYKCFGCGKGGNAVNFLMDHERMEYPEALEWLGKKFNVKVEYEKVSKEAEEKARQEEGLRESLRVVYRAAEDFYIRQRETLSGDVLGYYHYRFGKNGTLEHYGIGYAPNQWAALWTYLTDMQFQEDILKESGLFVQAENGNFIDLFRDRVVFPISDHYGRTIAFSARIHPQTDVSWYAKKGQKAPKYVNSPETAIFQKRKVLYGLDIAREAVRSGGVLNLVEGQTDVIALQTSGLLNTAGVLGTALHEDHIALIRRYAREVNLMPDNDTAGSKALNDWGRLLLKAGLQVSVTRIEGVKDWDEKIAKGLEVEG